MKSLNEIKFLFKHSSIYGLGIVLSQLVGFLLLPLYTRHLTPADYGVLQLVDITTGIIGVVVGLGLASALSRFYYEDESEDQRNKVVSTTYISMGIMAGVSLLLLSTTAEWLAESILDNKKYGLFFDLSFLSLFLGIILDIGQIYLRMLHKSTLYVSVSMLGLVIGVSLNVFFVAFMEYGVLGILYANVITKLIIVIPMTILIIRKIGIALQPKLAIDMLKYSIPLIPSSVATTIVNYSDRYYIKFFVSIHDAGIYALANKIGTAIHMLITSPFIMTFLPRRFEIAEQENVQETFSKIFDYYMLMITFSALGLSIFSYEIIHAMTTTEFYRAAQFIPFIALTMVIFGMKYHFEFGILYSKKTKYYMYINVTTSIIHVVLNYFMISKYGIWGALYSSIFVISLNTFLIYLVSQSLFRIKYNFMCSVKILSTAIILYSISLITISTSIFITVVYKLLLISCYPFILILIDVIKPNELAYFKSWAKELRNGA